VAVDARDIQTSIFQLNDWISQEADVTKHFPLIILAATLGCMGCSGFQLNQHSQAVDEWLNRNQSELIKIKGRPQSTMPDSNGGTILVYEGSTEMTTETPSDGTYSNSPPTTYIYRYRNSYYVNPQGIIYNWNWSDSDGRHDDLDDYVTDVKNRARKGSASAARWLGYWYSDGMNGLTQDYVEAMRWDRMAADKGLEDAQNNLGLCYLDAAGHQDYSLAFHWFQKSAEQGYSEGEYDLGLCYQQGKGVEKDLGKAGIWFQKAAAQGNSAAKDHLEEVRTALHYDLSSPQ
jgi:hypothetical protein